MKELHKKISLALINKYGAEKMMFLIVFTSSVLSLNLVCGHSYSHLTVPYLASYINNTLIISSALKLLALVGSLDYLD